MGKLYDGVQEVERIVERKGLDRFKAIGQVSMRTRFMLSLVSPDDPDDPVKIEALRAAALEVLGERIHV